MAHHPNLVAFRAGDRLVEALQERARDAGCSRSEYLRSMVRDHLGLGEAPPPINVAVQPTSLHEAAARGDGDAYALIANLHYQRGLNGEEPAIIAFARAADASRFSTVISNDRQAWLNHLFLLDCYSDALRAAGYGTLADQALGEAIAMSEYMADDGDEEMSHMVATAPLTAEALNFARELRAQIKEQIGC